MSGKLKAGIVGCGGIAGQKHFPALSLLKDEVEITYFCDIIEERAVNASKEFGIPGAKVSTDYKDVVNDGSIDIIYVLTPNVNHSPITCDALAAGKHVMCEKPMAINYAEGKKMLDAARASGKKLTIGYQNRFRRDSRELFARSRDGELGEVYFAKAHAVRRRAVPTWGVFPDKAKQGGGPLIDIGTHALDLTLWFMNNYEPECVLGQTFQKLKDYPDGNMFGPWDPAKFETEDSAFGMIRMKNGAAIYLEAAWALNVLDPKEAQVTLCGTKAGAEMFGDAWKNEGYNIINKVEHNNLVSIQPSGAGGVYGFASAGSQAPQDLEARQWIGAIKNNSDPLVKPEEALVVTRILEAIYESAYSKKPVYF
ncbi:MAG: Gfo/Idh/MocA family oxidoreductase [Treponema sp.]|nr:Gfo/Idh/MocA family oxidoreductase [Treponema sp.]